MRRVLAVLLALPLVVHAQTRPRKIFISVDTDAHGVKGTFRDMLEVTKLLQVLTSFAAP